MIFSRLDFSFFSPPVLYSYSSTVLKDALMRFQLQNEIEKININYKKRGKKKKFIYEFNRDTIIMIMMVESHCSQSNISFPFYISYRLVMRMVDKLSWLNFINYKAQPLEEFLSGFIIGLQSQPDCG